MKAILCVGGPWDGSVTSDVGTYLRVHKEREHQPFTLKPFDKILELVTYVKIALKRRDGEVIYVYEAEGTDAAMELWQFYLKNKAQSK